MSLPRLRWLNVLLVPGGLMFALALLLFRPHVLPTWIDPLIALFPTLVYIFGLILGWALDRARPVVAMLFFVAADCALGFFTRTGQPADNTGQLVLGWVSFWLPLDLLLLAALGERGLFSRTTVVPILLLCAEGITTWWLCRPDLQELGFALLAPTVEPEWMAWAPVPQPPLFAFVAALAVLIFQFVLAPTLASSSAIWSLASSYVAFHATTVGWSPSGFLGTAAMIVCWASIASHYRTTYRDELTGIRGHAALDRALSMLGRRYAVAIVDIDRLRHVNDTYSETLGDRVLCEVAAVLAGVSGGGKAFRYSGEEFAILFPGRSSGEALVAMEQLRKRIEQASIPAPAGRRASRHRSCSESGTPTTISVTVSIGIADSFDHPTNASEVIRAAYRAVALAKLDGGNRVTRWTAESQSGRFPAASRRCS